MRWLRGNPRRDRLETWSGYVSPEKETFLRECRSDLRRSGLLIITVPPGDPDEPGFHYTVGMTEHGYAELIAYDLPDELGHRLLNDLANLVLQGEAFSDGDPIPQLVPGECQPRLWAVTRFKDSLGVAFDLYGEGNVTARQLVLPDGENRWPWQRGYDGPKGQVLLFDPPSRSSG